MSLTCLCSHVADAQQWIQVTTCGTPPKTGGYPPGQSATILTDKNGNLCTSASLSISSVTVNNTVNNPVVSNVAQFGGANVVTGTGVGGAGVPRVTVSSDSTLSATLTPPTVNNPWVDNIAQFGGANVVTGTGLSGAGIPRVTVSSDSAISISPPTVNNPWVDNIAQFGGANVVTGTGVGGAGIPRVTVSNDSVVGITGTVTVTATGITIANTVNNPLVDNIAQFGGANVVTGQGVGGAGIPRVTVARDSVDVNNPWVDNISRFGGSNVVTGQGVSGAGIPRVTIAKDSVDVNSPWVDNISQFGGSNVVTGTGAGGAGIPRVTISNDSTIGIVGTPTVTFTNVTVGNTVNNPVVDNIAQFGGSNVVTGTGNSGAGIPRVTVASDSGIGITSIASVTSGAYADGALTTEGARGDAVYGGSGSATMNSVLKGIYAIINNVYSFFSNGSNLIGTVNPVAANWGLGTVGSAAVSTAAEIASVASSSELNKATAGNIQYPLVDLSGKLVISPYANRENFLSGSVSTSQNGFFAIIGTPANSTFSNYITGFGCMRSDTGTTAMVVTTNDTTTNGVQGATAWAIPNSGGGGGFLKDFEIPMKIAAGKAFQIDVLSTGVISLFCHAHGFLGY